jgi:hypothetical protein
MLLKYEPLFNGTLGDWNLLPVSFELKEGVKPYHSRAYPIPHIHKATLMKEIDRLCKIEVLIWQPQSKWALPSFILVQHDFGLGGRGAIAAMVSYAKRERFFSCSLF